MLPHERQQEILDLIRAKGTVLVSELSPLFKVTPMTIRRDLHALANRSLLEQTYGGATIMKGTAFEPPVLSRQAIRVDQKKAIAKKAAELVEDGETIALDVGTTTLELARCLKGRSSLVVLTASPRIALELAANPGIRVILAGGVVRPGEFSVVGEIAVDTFTRFFVDKAFLGAAAASLAHGVSDYSLEDTSVKKAMIARAREVILLADSSKFDKIAFAQVCPVGALRLVITDGEMGETRQADLRRLGVEVILADS